MKQYKKLKTMTIILVGTLILVGILLLLERSGTTNFIEDSPATGVVNGDTESINYDPPTEEEQKRGDKKKEDLTNNTDQSQEQGSSKNEVHPVIASAGQFDSQIEVRSFIPGIYESSGTCTVVFTKDNNKIERQVEGIQDATTTRCDTVTILREDFPSSGTWTVKVNYSSPSSQGESDVTSFEVQ